MRWVKGVRLNCQLFQSKIQCKHMGANLIHGPAVLIPDLTEGEQHSAAQHNMADYLAVLFLDLPLPTWY